MSLVTLSDVLQPALSGGYAVAGLVALGWEDMRAYVAAAEAENVPVILQAGPCLPRAYPAACSWQDVSSSGRGGNGACRGAS
jgi:fructose/tagatose bisphosphate aldolase